MKLTFKKIVLSVISLTLFACGSDSEENSGELQELVNVSIGTISGAVVNFLPTEIALANGYFAEEGLNVELVYLQGGSRVGESLLAGGVDVAVAGTDHAIKAISSGRDVSIIGAINRYPGMVLVVGDGDRYSEVPDLSGQRVGVTSPGSLTYRVLDQILVQGGISIDSVVPVYMGFGGMIPALENGEIQAAILVEPLVSTVEQRGIATSLVDLTQPAESIEFFGGEYLATTFMALAEFTSEQPLVADKLIRAFDRALAFIDQNSATELVTNLPSAWQNGGETMISAIERSKFLYPPTSTLTVEGILRVSDDLSVDRLEVEESIWASNLNRD